LAANVGNEIVSNFVQSEASDFKTMLSDEAQEQVEGALELI
jgi:hypothetical protein